ncbi:hypothetical protein [Candidatus Borreliella tachyglossi]|uniref:hypothetical protein n=1 Tax=Candidatus Borreliella tachyglossi TaxID=1964448 RepID=UPI004041C18A
MRFNKGLLVLLLLIIVLVGCNLDYTSKVDDIKADSDGVVSLEKVETLLEELNTKIEEQNNTTVLSEFKAVLMCKDKFL